MAGIAVSIQHLDKIWQTLENKPRPIAMSPTKALGKLVKKHGYKSLIKHKIRLKQEETHAENY